MFKFIGSFLLLLGLMVVGTVLAVPRMRRQARASLERQRRLTDNDPRLIEAIALNNAAVWGIALGAAMMLPLVMSFGKLGDAIGMFFFMMVPTALVLIFGLKVFTGMYYGDTRGPL